MASVQNIGRLKLGFKGSQMTWIDNNGMILLSNNSNFAFGFQPTEDVTLFLLVVMHQSTQTLVWSANRASPVRNSDYFLLDDTGNAYLQSGGSTIWATNTGGKGVSAMELRDSGNLVLVGNDSSIIWQSFSHPVDTLLSSQEFIEGMKLVSSPNPNNLSYSLEIKSGDVLLSASFKPPQQYWAMGNDNRKTINKVAGSVVSAILDANSWKFYDESKTLIWQFIFSDNTDANATWVAVLGEDGFLTFSVLGSGGAPGTSTTKIPKDECGRPAACDPYFVCYKGIQCQCPSSLPSCKPGTSSLCNKPESVELVESGDSLGYSALGFTSPSSTTDLNGCKTSCLKNCSCVAMFFDNRTEHCFLFNQIGSLQGSVSDVYAGFRYYKKKTQKLPESPKDSSEEDNFLQGLSGMPMMEEGKLKDIIDMKLRIDENDERAVRAIRVALWCIQDDMSLRPSMTKVVQMLEGLCPVFKSISEEGTSSGASAPSDYNSNTYMSAVRLSGPR
nr:G-type lectin S-receptor-like serine/threonine-protein kinase SD2-5 [Ipomoea batatas]GME19539.1 G-type lectin S-receptor-like serine/threonine-protein kinase SD2-5 [Ipomoea batatas]